MSEHVKISQNGPVMRITMTRPEKKNALTGAMYNAMTGAILSTEANDDIRAIIFMGADGVFTAGNDIGDFLRAGEQGDMSASPALHFIKTIAATATPLIAAVDGLAIGIGTTMLLHCDLVYASPRAKFRMPFVDLALVPEAASSLLLPQRVGIAKATELLMLGEGFDAAEALRLGLVNAIVAPDALNAHALAQAEKLAAKPAAALAATRRLLRGDPGLLADRIDLEIQALSIAMQSAEARQIFQSFLNRDKG